MEPFLINPPKKKRKKKAVSTARIKHRPVLYSSGRNRWSRGPKSRSKLAGIQINPFGGELALLGLNPRRRKRRKVVKLTMNPRRRRKTRARRRHRNPMGFLGLGLNPRRRRRHGRKRRMGASSRRRLSRKFHTNPALGMRMTGPMDLMNNLPLIATGALSAIATVSVPALTGIGVGNPMVKYGVQLATALGGGWVVGRFIGRNHGTVWALTGSAVVLADILKTYVLGGMLGLSAYPEDLSAFPDDDELSTYPQVAGGYGQDEGEEEVSGLGYELEEVSPYQ